MTETAHAIFSTLPFFVSLFWWILLMLQNRRRQDRAVNALILFAMGCSLLYFCHAVYFCGEEGRVVQTLYCLAHLSVFPCFWLYIRSLSEPEPLRLRDGWVLLPAWAGALLTLLQAWLGIPQGFLDLGVTGIFLVEVLWVCLAGIFRLDAYDREVSDFYSDTEHKSVGRIRKLLFLMVLTSVASVVAGVMGRSRFSGITQLSLVSAVFSALLFCIFYAGSRQEYTASELSASEEPDTPAPDAIPAEEEQRALLEQVDGLMGSREFFRIPGLKITDVARELGTNRTYVSACINSIRGQSFSEYVNAYRVSYVQQRLKDRDAGKTLAQIGAEAGFSGETSFFRNFKKFTGCTPMEWLSEQD